MWWHCFHLPPFHSIFNELTAMEVERGVARGSHTCNFAGRMWSGGALCEWCEDWLVILVICSPPISLVKHHSAWSFGGSVVIVLPMEVTVVCWRKRVALLGSSYVALREWSTKPLDQWGGQRETLAALKNWHVSASAWRVLAGRPVS